MTATTRRAALALALSAAVSLGGCGLPERVVGIHEPAVEATGGAPLAEPTAQAIAVRSLGAAATARADRSKNGPALRKAALTGSAFAMAEAGVSGSAGDALPDPLAKPPPPRILAMATGQAWPRTMLVTTKDPATEVQSLVILVSAKPTTPYLVSASVPLLGGAVVPALGPVSEGTELVTSGSGLVAAPAALLAEYAAALGYPKPKPSAHVAMTDALSTSLRSSAAAQSKALGKLATLTSAQTVVPQRTIAFRLADGSALVFGQFTRTDTVTVAKAAKEVVLPPAIAALVGKAKVTKSVTSTTIEVVAIVVPKTGKATVVGADEQLAAAKGS